MMKPNANDRHLSLSNLARYVESKVQASIPVAGNPPVTIFIDPVKPEMGLRVVNKYDHKVPEINLEHISARSTVWQGRRYLEVAIDDQSLFLDAYGMLCSMADRIQIDGQIPVEALQLTLRKMSLLLQRTARLSMERELGLIGELLTLAAVLPCLGQERSIAAWRGPEAEEHDFGMPEIDIEVKTTSAERRVHWIESLTQMMPTGPRPLWLVSHQLTKAGAGDGIRLPGIIASIRSNLTKYPASDEFEQKLSASGWDDRFEAEYYAGWFKRTSSVGYFVCDKFPRMTRPMVQSAGVDLSKIVETKYKIDLTDVVAEDRVPEMVQVALANGGIND